jgi:hypothetical protein|tara:strand:+ start:800 stop:1156 length:357 start_codon:yes stop_codon:yes gene_type:complete
MAISYSWDVSRVDTYPTHNSQTDVVYNVHWRLTAIDDANTEKDMEGNDIPVSANVYGSQSLDTSDLSSFTAFTDLTASDVQGWVESALGSDKVTTMKAGLDAQIAEKITPTSVTKTIG